MNKEGRQIEWGAEFQEFLAAEESAPPAHVTSGILAQVRADLNPAAWLVFAKVSLIHLVIGTVSLLFCPQFGMGLSSSMGLMSLLMKYGDAVCMFGCGVFFLGSTALIASLLLRPEEVRVIRRTEWLQFSLLGTLSVGVFLCLGAPIIVTLALFWLLGSVLGAALSLELGWRIRARFRRRLVYGT